MLAWISSPQNDAYLVKIAMRLLTKLERLIDGVFYDVGKPSAKQPMWDEWKRVMTSGCDPLEALDDLFQSPYFSRVWTIQEIFLSRNVIIRHGGFAVYFRTLLFKAVQDGRWAIPQISDSGYSNTANVHAGNFLSSYHRMLCGRPSTALEGLLLAQDRCVTKKHDSVSGILGSLH